MQEMNDIYT